MATAALARRSQARARPKRRLNARTMQTRSGEGKQRVLFLCTTNSSRSQMAEGILNWLGRGRFEAHSAGAEATSVHPLAIEAMAQIGVDISGQQSKSVDLFTGQQFDYVITLCGGNAKEFCPAFIGRARHRVHWDFEDPAEATGSKAERLLVFVKVRDQIRERVEAALLQL